MVCRRAKELIWLRSLVDEIHERVRGGVGSEYGREWLPMHEVSGAFEQVQVEESLVRIGCLADKFESDRAIRLRRESAESMRSNWRHLCDGIGTKRSED